jgi:type VI secretion system protein ImpG
MNREFLEFYDREIKLLRSQAAEFALEYPGIADRLGGLVGDRQDPMIVGLLEGAAFLAARVQLKLKHEFSEFTTNLIDQLAPQYLAPAPSYVLIEARPTFGDAALREGRTIGQGAYLDATYREAARNVACRFRLAAPITLWPFEVAQAEYLQGAGALQALGASVGADCAAGLRLRLVVRAAPRLEDEPDDSEAFKKPELAFSASRVKRLRVSLLAPEADAAALYEQIFAHCSGLYFRTLDSFGDPVVHRHDLGEIKQIGFDEDDGLEPDDKRMFRGFTLLRDYFTFPRRFLGFDIGGLGALAPRLNAKSVDVILAFNELNPRLAASVRKEAFSLTAAPAANIFEKRLDRIQIKSNMHEYHVVPDRTRTLDYEPNRIQSVFAHIPGVTQKIAVEPLYSAAAGRSASGLTYVVRRLPRQRTVEERKYGKKSDYVGSDMFLSLGERGDPEDLRKVSELSVEAWCTNRHMAEHLPVGQGGADFRFLDAVDIELRCVAGPTRPREPVLTSMVGKTDGATTGEVAWRLINMLSLNHLGLVDRAGGGDAKALREMLTLFADASDGASDRKLRGVRGLDAKPIVRRVRTEQGAAVARGLEMTVTLDEKAFEGSGAYLFGAVLDRFFVDYVAINHFTQTVVRTNERGEIMRWPPRLGRRGVV